MSLRRPRTHAFLVLVAALFLLIASPLAHAASKLQAFYSGSGGISSEVHRVVIIEFAADGSVILQQTWHGKPSQTWHGRYTRDKKIITVTFERARNEAPDTKPIAPLVMTFKKQTLTPTSWDTTALGPLGPPTLRPFSGSNVQQPSVLTCQSLNSVNPAHNCVTWGTRN